MKSFGSTKFRLPMCWPVMNVGASSNVPVELLTPTDWTVDQAMSFIISGGAVSPESMPFTRAGER